MVYILTLLLPITMFLGLYSLGYNGDTRFIIDVFLPIAWAVMIAYGSCIIMLGKVRRSTNLNISRYENLNRKITQVSWIMLIQTLFFVILTVAYPLKSIFLKLDWITKNLKAIAIIYDSVFIALILNFCLISIIVGAWVIYLETQKDS